jgi:hypothetical protein
MQGIFYANAKINFQPYIFPVAIDSTGLNQVYLKSFINICRFQA